MIPLLSPVKFNLNPIARACLTARPGTTPPCVILQPCKTKMKKLYLFLPLLCLVPAACSTSVVNEPETETHAISFRAPQAETRAVVDGTSLPGNFLVWGGYEGDATRVFEGTTVYSPDWDYRDGTRYWTEGKLYDFYAVYPTGVTAAVSEEGIITIEDFDCSATGEEAVDLMTATAPNVSADKMIQDGSAVGLTFQHELARVKFIAVSEGDAITITDAKLYGISRTGDLNGSTWTLDVASSSDSPSFETKSLSINDNDTDEHLLFGGDLLLIPQDLTNEATFVFTYQYDGETGTHSVSSTLSTVGTVADWDAGKSYNYRVSIPQHPVDVTLTVTVTDWIEENFTVEW